MSSTDLNNHSASNGHSNSSKTALEERLGRESQTSEASTIGSKRGRESASSGGGSYGGRRTSMGKMEKLGGSGRRLSSTATFQRKYSKRMSRRMSLAVPAPEGGWGWVVCLASCWTNGTIFGIINSFGVLFVVMLDELEGATSFKTAWVGSVCAGLTFMLSPIASVVTDQLGCRVAGVLGGALATAGMLASSFVTRVEYMYLTYGLMTGLGFSIAYNPSLFILGLYFKRRLGLANGLVTFGSGVFTMVLPIALKQILDAVGLAYTIRVLAGVIFIMMLGALVFKPVDTTIEIIEQIENKYANEVEQEKMEKLQKKLEKKRKRRTLRQSLEKVFDTSIWKVRNYQIWVIGIPAGLFGYFVPFTHLVKHTNDILPGYNAEVLIACIGATSGAGRLLFGYISDSPRIKNRVQLQQLSYLIMGVCTTLLPVAVSYGALIAVTLVMGIFDGCFVAMMGPVAFDLVGKEKASQGIGMVLGLMAFPMMIGPPIAGFIYDHTSSYTPAFFLSGASPIIGACILCLIRKPKPNDDDDDDDVFLEQKSSLITATDGSSSSDTSQDGNGNGGGRTRRNGHYRRPFTPAYNLESELPKKKRPSFFLGGDPDDEVKIGDRKSKTSFMYGPEPVPAKILYSALKENPTNPNRPRLPSNRTSNVSFADVPRLSSEEEEEEEAFPETYILTSKHTIV